MEENSTDLATISEVAKVIPEQAWNRLVATACDTFEKCVAPITELTGGIGRLISAKFNRFVEGEKILAAEVFERAHRKLKNNNFKPTNKFKMGVIVSVLSESSKQTDMNLRELWANLLAQEMLDGSVHPEVVRILSRISAEDAQTLADIAENTKSSNYTKSFSSTISGLGLTESDGEISASFGFLGIKTTIRRHPKFTFSEKFLENLNLIERVGKKWELTAMGEGFIASVSEPEEISND